MSHFRRASAVCLCALAAGVLAPGATAEANITLTSIAAGATDRRLGPDVLQAGPGAVLAAVAGTGTYPTGCGTPLVQFLLAPEIHAAPLLAQAQSSLGTRPRIEMERIASTGDGRFAIHYSASPGGGGLAVIDRDRNGQPDLIDRVGEALVASESFLTDRMGYPSPVPATDPLDVYLIGLGHGLEGFTVPPRRAGGPAFLVLDEGTAAERIMPAVFHQAAHAALSAFGVPAPRWWSEATASWLTFGATSDLPAHADALQARLRAAGRALASDDLLVMEGSLLWPMFLAERTGDPGVIRLIWVESAAREGDPLAATDAVLSRAAGMRLADAAREFAVWNLFTGERDDGLHYAAGRLLPTAPPHALGPALPVRLDPVEPVEGLGSVAFRLPGDGRRGVLDLELWGTGGLPAADLLVNYRASGSRPVLVPVTLDAVGAGRVTIPWTDAREVIIVLRNDAAWSEPARFAVRAAYDPYAPYDLASFGAEMSGRSLVLTWTTASERGLLGWNILRSEAPDGPFTRLNDVAVPAFGDGGADIGYVFVDATPRAGRRTYYLLEGLTDSGLVERSHVISGRVGTGR